MRKGPRIHHQRLRWEKPMTTRLTRMPWDWHDSPWRSTTTAEFAARFFLISHVALMMTRIAKRGSAEKEQFDDGQHHTVPRWERFLYVSRNLGSGSSPVTFKPWWCAELNLDIVVVAKVLLPTFHQSLELKTLLELHGAKFGRHGSFPEIRAVHLKCQIFMMFQLHHPCFCPQTCSTLRCFVKFSPRMQRGMQPSMPQVPLSDLQRAATGTCSCYICYNILMLKHVAGGDLRLKML